MPVIPISSATRPSRSRSAATATTSSQTRTIKTNTSGSPPGGTGDWHGTVESRLDGLREDVRGLLIGGVAIALALAGIGWGLYENVVDDMTELKVSQQAILGKIETLDTKLTGKFELMEQKNNRAPAGTIEKTTS